MSKRTQQQLSNWRILKNVNDTLKELQKNKSEVAYNQRVQLVAAVCCPRYGVPAVEETRSVIEAGKVMRRKLFTGTEHILKIEAKKEKEYFPQEVHKMAEDSWLNKSTIPEPAKHLRPHCIKKDGGDTVPARLQINTDDEAYQTFRDEYEDSVKDAMKQKCEQFRNKHSNDTQYNNLIKEKLKKQESWFPGKTWFLSKKPEGTKANYEHTTGLCKDCHMYRSNYDTLLKHSRSLCHCGSKSCPYWICLCDNSEECVCNHTCQCDDCLLCQVNINYFILN